MPGPNIRILVAHHKAGPYMVHDAMLPIHVGRALAKAPLPIQGDDTGDHISRKNPHYNELTAMYWAWKNLKGVDIVGLTHYRRHFLFDRAPLLCDQVDRNVDGVTSYQPNMERILAYLGKHDVILPRPQTLFTFIEAHYKMYHIREDFDLLTEVLGEMRSEDLDAWKAWTRRSNKLIGHNMFISRWPFFATYCEWLFPILGRVEALRKPSPHPYQERALGFMAERLFSFYCSKNTLRIKYLPVLFFTETPKTRNFSGELRRRVKNDLSVWLCCR